MVVKTLSKHELRTQETRRLLLQAAETIFVRDGYEGAELGEIAALAGRTKGAIYAQFKGKEDIFLALFEQRRAKYHAEMTELLADSESAEENLAILCDFYLKFIKEPTWALLLLEFKLFASRHAEIRKKFQTTLREGLSEAREQEYSEVLGSTSKRIDAISRGLAIHMAPPILSALALEMKVSQPDLSEDVITKVARQILNLLFEIQPGKPGMETTAAQPALQRNRRGGRPAGAY
ncbi:MAG: TetR/AcrR family transcriptional regulator [Bryobacterales bacterium]|nr:TetR/AcrR family transcriptional regulator [Bryobacterales bacterium]